MSAVQESDISRREFIVLMSMIWGLSAVAIDFMTPAFADVRAHFGLAVGSTAAAQIVTFYFLGEAGQVFFGPFSDRFGRIPILRFGLGLYATGALVSIAAPTFAIMLAARFAWGFGAAALQVSAFAMIRDRFSGDEMARVMSYVFAVFLVVPIVAPLGGSLLLAVSSWQIVFGFPAGAALLVFLWSLRLSESRPESNIISIRLGSVLRTTRKVMSNPTMARYTLAATFTFAAFSSFLSSFERIMGEFYGRASAFPIVFASMAAFQVVVILSNERVVRRWSARQAARGFMIAYLVLGGVFLAGVATSEGVPSYAFMLVMLTLVLAANTTGTTNFAPLALEPMGEHAGIASAVYGSIYIAGGATLGSIVDRMIDTTLTPWAIAMLLSAALALLIMPRRPQPTQG